MIHLCSTTKIGDITEGQFRNDSKNISLFTLQTKDVSVYLLLFNKYKQEGQVSSRTDKVKYNKYNYSHISQLAS